MPVIAEIEQYGNSQTRITFDYEAFEAWKADRATWHREQYANNPAYRAVRQKARRKSDTKRRKTVSPDISPAQLMVQGDDK